MSELDNLNNSFDSQDSSLPKNLVTPELKDAFDSNALPNADAFIDPLSKVEEIAFSDYPDSEGQIIWSENEVGKNFDFDSSSHFTSLEGQSIGEQFIVNHQAVLENFERHNQESNLLDKSLALSNSKLEIIQMLLIVYI
jgi:hypothetical protein